MTLPSEPPIQPHDTQPRQPTQVLVPDPSWSTPLDTRGLIAPDDERANSRIPCLLGMLVVLASALMCGLIVTLSAVAGYRDELRDIQTEEAIAAQATNSIQYELALENVANGQFELALVRFNSIVTTQPDYLDVVQQIQQVEIVLSYTPTPSSTSTPTVTPSPTLTPTVAASPTLTANPAQTYFDQAMTFYNFGRWEDTIETLDIVISFDPTFRRAEVDQMLFDAYNQQSRIYFNGGNPLNEANANGFPGNQLARGVFLYNLAVEMIDDGKPVGTRNDLDGFTAFFAEGFITARRYIDAGQNSLAVPILQELCDLNCTWGYRGLTIQDLLNQAQGG